MESMKCIDNHAPIYAVGGNFIGHMKQAGESKEIQQEKPKFLFPLWYPSANIKYPVSVENNEQNLTIPLELQNYDKNNSVCVQTEPELGVLARVVSDGKKVEKLTVTHIFPSNEFSIRGIPNDAIWNLTGPKPDYMVNYNRKMWGPGSQGIGLDFIKLEEENVIPDDISIEANIIRDGVSIPYGIKTRLGDMTFKNQFLWDYITDELNNSENNQILKELVDVYGEEFDLIISLGATLYHPDFVYEDKKGFAGHQVGDVIEIILSREIDGKNYFSKLSQKVVMADKLLSEYVEEGYVGHKVLAEILK